MVTVDEGPEDLTHLCEPARAVARLPASERIRHIRADRWIGYPSAVMALDRLETLFTWPPRQRMPNLLLVGPTNNGKSMIVEKFELLFVAVDVVDDHLRWRSSSAAKKVALRS